MLLQKNYFSQTDFSEEYDPYSFEKAESIMLMHKYIKGLNKRCQMLLKMVLADHSYEEICKELGYKTKDNAISKKYKCLKLLMKRIKQDPKFDQFKKN